MLMLQNKTQIVYKLDGVNATDGVDIFEIAPVLMQFGELIKSANDVLGFENKIDVKVRPFREGSWITDFIIHQSTVETLLTHLKSSNGQNLTILLSLLGLNIQTGVTGVASIVRKTQGLVNNYRKNDDETVTYTQPDGTEFIVSLPEHRLVQSPVVQVNYYNSLIKPLDKFPTASSVDVQVGENTKAQSFTIQDKESFDTYAQQELLEDVDDNVTTMSGIYLKPKRGSYSGEEKAYSFVMGESNVLWPVTMEDQAFLDKLKSGEIRPYSEDVLKVNLEIRQKKDSANRLTSHYAITEVTEYVKYSKPQQIKLDSLYEDE
jgi:hypothetical protein